jgi:hypothetical protein
MKLTWGNLALQDLHLQKRLQQVLKLNKEKWEEAREHALKAVVVDNRMRVWWASPSSGANIRIGASPLLLGTCACLCHNVFAAKTTWKGEAALSPVALADARSVPPSKSMVERRVLNSSGMPHNFCGACRDWCLYATPPARWPVLPARWRPLLSLKGRRLTAAECGLEGRSILHSAAPVRRMALRRRFLCLLCVPWVMDA